MNFLKSILPIFLLFPLLINNLSAMNEELDPDKLPSSNITAKSTVSEEKLETNSSGESTKKKKKRKKTKKKKNVVPQQSLQVTVDPNILTKLSSPQTRHEAYLEIYEGPSWTTFPINFEVCDQIIYENFINQTLKFDQLESLNHERKVLHLFAWAQLTGVPIIGLIRNEKYFRDNLHIIPNPEVQVPIPQKDSDHLFYSWKQYTFGPAGYNQDDIFIDFVGPKKVNISKRVSSSLRANVLLYHHEEDLSWYNDLVRDEEVKRENIDAYKKRALTDTISPKICFDFLNDYLADLRDFTDPYLDQVIMGIRALPKRIVNVIRGRAIYLSQEYGPSMTIHTASNIRKIDYLGLIPGVFVERLKGGDHILHTQLVHEVGHLVHQLVIMKRFYDSQLKLETMCISPEFQEFQDFLDELNSNFPESSNTYNENAHKKEFQQNLDRFGYITYYAQQNRSEDFAEVFKYYILHHKYLRDTGKSRTVIKKKMADKNLTKKIELMGKIVGLEGITTGTNLSPLEYVYSEL